MAIQNESLEMSPMGSAEDGRLQYGVTTAARPGLRAVISVPPYVPSPEIFAELMAEAHRSELDWQPVPKPRRAD